MLSTLVKLGKELSKDRHPWADIIDIPNTSKEKSKNIPLYVGEIVFDLVQQRIYAGDLKEYDEKVSPFNYKNITIQGGNNKAIYICAEAGKVEQIRKSLFGKEENSTKGEFREAIDKDFTALNDTPFYKMLDQIFALKAGFLELYTHTDEKGKLKSIETVLADSMDLAANRKVVFWYVSVKASETDTPVPLHSLQGYDAFIQAKFLDKGKTTTTESKLSYVSGQILENVLEPDFSTRYSLNKMFVKETKNYASGFDDALFQKNYQASVDEQLYLERASKELLEKQQVKIAGIDHCIIPQFTNQTKITTQDALDRSFQKSELLFQTRIFEQIQTNIQLELDTEEPYWINFLGFESDGNFFKTINLIKDVSSLHLSRVVETFAETEIYMRKIVGGSAWESVMTEFVDKERKLVKFNLQTLYYVIPQRKDKEKKNEALGIFKSLLEQRKIDAQALFAHFCNLVLCHYYPTRYEAYKNVRKYGADSFDFAMRDSVFKYLAFLHVLKQLNLITHMENPQVEELEPLPQEETPSFQQRIDFFLDNMNYNEAQRAMFYLGRMLNIVIYIQKDKKRNVLEKVNFNGMDRSDIERLRCSLIEKAKQYGKVHKVVFSDAQFVQYFNYNKWESSIGEQEAVFFLLSGYSFGFLPKEG